MQTLFCTECGHKMHYAGAKPKFCAGCGVSIDGASGEPASAPISRSRKVESIRDQMKGRLEGGESIDDEYETDIDDVPQLKDGLQYEISSSEFGNPIHKFEDVVNVSTEEETAKEKPKKARGRPKKRKT